MFPVESLHPCYTEEQSAKNAARRAAQQAALAQSVATSCASTPTLTPSTSAPQHSQGPQGPCPKTLTTALLNGQQNAHRSSGFFGSIIQSFSRTNSGTATPCLTRTAATTPGKEKTQAEVEAMIAERKRDADIVSISLVIQDPYVRPLTIQLVRYALLVKRFLSKLFPRRRFFTTFKDTNCFTVS